MFWGLIPHWSRDPKDAEGNATAEKARSSAFWKSSTEKRRCLVPVQGFYEWEMAGKRRLPHLFEMKHGKAFALAGIWQKGTETTPESVAIVTSRPNAILEAITHRRSPVMLEG